MTPPEQSVFTITYWGVTGTLTAPLRPMDVTDKIVAVLRRLAEQDRLADLKAGIDLEAVIRRRLQDEIPLHLRGGYGGNTTCVEVRTPDALLIFDCGSGFRELGETLEARWHSLPADAQRTAHVFLSHAHMDHIFGIPYFAPYYNSANRFTIWGAPDTLRDLGVLFSPDSELSRRFFPPTYEQMAALKAFHPLQAGSEFDIGSTHIRTHALCHPGGCLAFRLENAGRVFVFATDHEHREVPDSALADFARGADLLYTDGQYTLAEYEGRQGIGDNPPLSRRGWGHSTIEACASTAVAAEVRELHLGHRDPARSDEDLSRLEVFLQQCVREELRRDRRSDDGCRAQIAYEGLSVSY